MNKGELVTIGLQVSYLIFLAAITYRALQIFKAKQEKLKKEAEEKKDL